MKIKIISKLVNNKVKNSKISKKLMGSGLDIKITLFTEVSAFLVSTFNFSSPCFNLFGDKNNFLLGTPHFKYFLQD